MVRLAPSMVRSMFKRAIQLHPLGREIAKVIAEQFHDGDMVSHDWLTEKLDLELPDKPVTVAVHNKLALQRLTRMDELREALLDDHRIMLHNSPGEGYRLVPPAQQTATAMNNYTKKFLSITRRVVNQLEKIRDDLLTREQRRENADAKAKIGTLLQMGSKRTLVGNKKRLK